MSREEALTYLRRNWKYLNKKGLLAEAMSRYFKVYAIKDTEVVLDSPHSDPEDDILDDLLKPIYN